MITLPYVTVTAFKAYPTFLDVMNLRSGDFVAADQEAELFNILLKASAWADGYLEMSADGTITAHSRTENARVRLNRDGRISYHPNHIPATALTALSTGTSPNQMTAITDLTNMWIEDGRQFVGFPGGSTSPGFGALPFGPSTVAGELYTQWTYVAGFANTILAGAVAAGATSIVVQDATGIAKGSVLRIWDPGTEEAITVAASYVAGTTIPLVSPTAFAHTATKPTGVSALPPDIHLGVIMYTAALLQRPDTEKEDTFPSKMVKPNASVGGSHDGTGFVVEAKRLLEPYRRIR